MAFSPKSDLLCLSRFKPIHFVPSHVSLAGDFARGNFCARFSRLMIALWCRATGSGQVASVFKGSYSIVRRRIIYPEKISLKMIFFEKLYKWTFSHRNTIIPIFPWCFDVRRLKVSIDRTLVFHWPNCTARILFNGVETTFRVFTTLEKL